MISLRFVVWFLLSMFSLSIALVAFAISRQISALDYGWVNAVFVLGLWIGVVISLRRALLDDLRYGGGSMAQGVPATTLEYRRH